MRILCFRACIVFIFFTSCIYGNKLSSNSRIQTFNRIPSPHSENISGSQSGDGAPSGSTNVQHDNTTESLDHQDRSVTEDGNPKILTDSKGVIMNIYSNGSPDHSGNWGTSKGKEESAKVVGAISRMERDEASQTQHAEEQDEITADKENNEVEMETHNLLNELHEEKEDAMHNDEKLKGMLEAENEKENLEEDAIEAEEDAITTKSNNEAEGIRNKIHHVERDMKETEELIKDDENKMKETEEEELLKEKEIKQDEKEKLEDIKEEGESIPHAPLPVSPIENQEPLTSPRKAIEEIANAQENSHSKRVVSSNAATPTTKDPETRLKPCEPLSFLATKSSDRVATQKKRMSSHRRRHSALTSSASSQKWKRNVMNTVLS